MALTSEQVPIRLDPIAQGETGSILYVTFAPGKVQARSQSSRCGWNRNLDLDLTRMRDVYQINEIVSLLEPDEAVRLNLANYPQRAQEYGFIFKNFPIPDMSTPATTWPQFNEFIQGIKTSLNRGNNIAVHCMGGLGRAGTIASAVLVASGFTPEQAISWVQQQRPNSIKRASQQKFVRDYYTYLHS